jgi:hypothetical protein
LSGAAIPDLLLITCWLSPALARPLPSAIRFHLLARYSGIALTQFVENWISANI